MAQNNNVEDRPTFKVIGDKVTVHHKTKTLDGYLWFDTTFDFSQCSREQLLKWAADQRKIAWRASAGIKGLTNNEIEVKNLIVTEVDCSKTVERVHHVETPEDKKLKAKIKELTGGGMDIPSLIEALEKVKLARAMADATEKQEEKEES